MLASVSLEVFADDAGYVSRDAAARQKLFTGGSPLASCNTLKGTSGYGITLKRESLASVSLEVFADDAGYASTGRWSVSGGAIMCGGACVYWFSRTQRCVTLSTTEAEYVAPGDAVKGLLLLRQVWRFILPGKVMSCFLVFEGTQGAV